MARQTTVAATGSGCGNADQPAPTRVSTRAGWAASQASIVGSLAEQVADLVGAGEEHQPGERVDLERQVLVARQVDDLRLEVDRQLGVGFGGDSSNSWRCVSASTTIGSRPFFRALLRKMSAKRRREDRPDPPRASAPTARARATSRSPKLSPASRICRPAIAGRSMTNSGSLSAAVLVVAPVAEERLARGRPCR